MYYTHKNKKLLWWAGRGRGRVARGAILWQ